MFSASFNEAPLTAIAFSVLEGRKLDAFLRRITKILCHWIAFFLRKEPFASRARSPAAPSLSPKSCSTEPPSHFSGIHFHHSHSNSAAAPGTHTELRPHTANNAGLGALCIYSGVKYPLIRGWIKPATNLKWHLFPKTLGISPKVPVELLKLSLIKLWHSTATKIFL